MFQKIKNLLFQNKQYCGTDSVAASEGKESETDLSEIFGYPAPPTGIQYCETEKLINFQAELIAQLRESIGFTQTEFTELVMPVIQQYAAYVHLLPASENHHHSQVGGLFRHGIEVALFATKASLNTIFCVGYNPKDARETEPRWRLGVLLAGLIHDAGKAVSDIRISSDTQKENRSWQPHRESLADWCEEYQVQRYFPSWTENRHAKHEQYSPMLMGKLIPVQTLDWLHEVSDGPYIVEAMLDAAGVAKSSHVVSKLVKQADKTSVERDLRKHHTGINREGISVPVDKHLLDAIRSLLRSKTWTFNQKDARVWLFGDGHVHIAWKQAVPEIRSFLKHNDVPGVPHDADTLADILIEKGIAVSVLSEADGGVPGRYWPMQPELLGSADKPITLNMLRIAEVAYVFSGEPPAPTELHNQKQKKRGAEVKSSVTDGKNATEIQRAEAARSEIPVTTKNQKESPGSFFAVAQKIATAEVAAKKPLLVQKTQLDSGLEIKSETKNKKENSELESATEAKPEPISESEAFQTLKNKGVLAEALADLLLSNQADQIFLSISEKVAGQYPAVAKALAGTEGKWLETFREMTELGWIEPNPENPAIMVQQTSSQDKVLIFQGQISLLLAEILKLKKASSSSSGGEANNKKIQPGATLQSHSDEKTQLTKQDMPSEQKPEQEVLSLIRSIRDKAIQYENTLIFDVNICRRKIQKTLGVSAIAAVKLLEQQEGISIENGKVLVVVKDKINL